MLVLTASFAAAPAFADEVFLRLDGIPGDSSDAQHPGEISVTSFSLGVEAETSWTKGGGASVGKPNPGELRFTALVDRSIAGMVIKITEGKAVASATLSVRPDAKGSRTADYLRYSFEGMFFTAVGQGLSGTGRAAMAIAAVYKTIKIEVIGADGRVASCAYWDVSSGSTEGCAVSK
ncbi:MAG TPA: type VI secretion system tube protein Hcp [Casimicrobiaceae bacterium]|nr:type VI secretion system tube protein Hcp [Casimicrobiaceae bacterium]